ncbi:hypothetical protein AVEN_245250-1 [Araneus ventricosus]|uniref:Uncharacterized protein n=1 Tax=Araneus ventricosus TaxID=182803 RepID=A0A4Y2EC82_ARAVE|nr:hypothetical protein AVEN_245250-1 [Araneus ventricosus]
MRTDLSENCRRCDITSLPVNEIYVVCSSNVNSRDNESTNTITVWANFPYLDNSPNCIAKSMFSGASKFVIPAVNFGAADYVDLTLTGKIFMSHHLQFSELLKMIQDDVPMDGWDFIKFPSHTKAVARIVKLVTEASRKRVEPQNRVVFIRAALESRNQMSQFESKRDYKK